MLDWSSLRSSSKAILSDKSLGIGLGVEHVFRERRDEEIDTLTISLRQHDQILALATMLQADYARTAYMAELQLVNELGKNCSRKKSGEDEYW